MSENKIWLPPGTERPQPKPTGELNKEGETVTKVNVQRVIKAKEELIENYRARIKHTPELVSRSMVIAYSMACDDMLRAMDKAKIE